MLHRHGPRAVLSLEQGLMILFCAYVFPHDALLTNAAYSVCCFGHLTLMCCVKVAKHVAGLFLPFL